MMDWLNERGIPHTYYGEEDLERDLKWLEKKKQEADDES
jgi:predicted HTH domain antitoxin